MKLAIDKALETFKLQRDVEQLIGKLEEANRDLEEKVKSRTADLIKLNEEKDHLIAIVAHDLKSPLNNLTGLVSILEKDSNNLNTKQRYYLTLIKQLHDKMAGMINRILHTESIEKAKLEVSPQITHIKQMMESQVRHFHDQASAKNITLISETGEEDTTLFLDQDLLNQILDNLISNAIKFSPARKRVYVRLHNTGDTVKIEVEDEGPGIRKDEQDKLFVKYKKLSAAPTNNESSTGLGLSLVKKYVELMEGKVWCESEEGKGAKFIVVFPVEPLPA
jgi:signal transduction histidine kinase